MIKFSRLFNTKPGKTESEVPVDIRPGMHRYPSRDNVMSPQTHANTIYEEDPQDNLQSKQMLPEETEIDDMKLDSSGNNKPKSKAKGDAVTTKPTS